MNIRIRLHALLGNVVAALLVAGACVSVARADTDVSGLVGDGKTDNTERFTALLGSGAQTLIMPPGDYVTGKLVIPSNITITLLPGVILRDSGKLQPHDTMLTIKGENVKIIGTGAKCVANRNDYTTGEFRHGVFIWGAHNVSIVGLESDGQGGDGFYIGGPHGNPAQSIVLDHVVADNNRRNGLSITAAEDVEVKDSTFADTNGTDPQFGVDVEPDNPGDVIQDIKFVHLHTLRNVVGGFRVELYRLDGTSVPTSITVSGHNSKNDGVSVSLESNSTAQGLVKYSDGVSLNAKGSGIRLVDPYIGGIRFELRNVSISGSNAGGATDPSVASAIVVRRRPYDRVKEPFGNSELRDITVTAGDSGTRSPYGYWSEGPSRFLDKWNGIAVDNLSVTGMPIRQK